MMISGLSSKHTSPEEALYRMNCIKAIAKANISIHGLEDMKEFLDFYSKDGLSIGYPREICRTHVKTVRSMLLDQLKTLTKHCFEEFSISLDGTPSFAEAECIMLRIVTRKFDIVEVVARLALYKNKLNSDNLAKHIISTICNRLALDLSTWLSVQLDRASTNKAAIQKIKDTHNKALFATNYCGSHGLNNVGKQFYDVAKNAEEFRKLYSAILQYNGKGRQYASLLYSAPVKTAHGVLFFQKIELNKYSPMGSQISCQT